MNYKQNRSLADALAKYQSTPALGPWSGLASALAGFGTGYFGGRANQIEDQTRMQMAEALKSGNLDSAYNIASTSGIPEYEKLGVEGAIKTNLESQKAKKLADAISKWKTTGDASELAGVEGGLDYATKLKKLNEPDNAAENYKAAGGAIFNVKDGTWIIPPKDTADEKKKPLNATTAKIQNDSLSAINTAAGIDKNLSAFEKQIDEGRLNFGFFSNLINKARNGIGLSNEESNNYNSFATALEKLRNDSLRLNNGVQTEGDATRAWDELINNLNDENIVKQRLAEIRSYNQQAVEFHKAKINQAREDAGASPIEYDQFMQQQPIYDRQQQPEITEEDINYTAQKHGITPEEVKKRLGVQ